MNFSSTCHLPEGIAWRINIMWYAFRSVIMTPAWLNQLGCLETSCMTISTGLPRNILYDTINLVVSETFSNHHIVPFMFNCWHYRGWRLGNTHLDDEAQKYSHACKNVQISIRQFKISFFTVPQSKRYSCSPMRTFLLRF